MESLWVIIRSVPESESESSDEIPTVCGVYKSREEAVEEVLKLYIEDDLDLYEEPKNTKDENKEENDENKDNKEEDEEGKGYDFRPTTDIVKDHRQRLLTEEDVTYTNRGNLYTLVECILGAKHEFDEDVLSMYESSL